jgi:3-hydroxyacyl-CoA dehydrogenase
MAIRPFSKVCVIGSGVMGSGIAAHLANARVPVLLLDIVPKPTAADEQAKVDTTSRAFRDRLSAGAKERALKTKPAPFFSKADATLVEVGNLEDDLGRLNECDWIIEVVLENLAIKQQLFEKIETALTRDDTLITSNTSGLKIDDMLQGRSESFQKRFFVTHFFNPVRYLHLLEIVKGPKTDEAAVQRVADFGETRLGKGIVYGKDTPNFVANRIGVFGMMETMRVMIEDGYNIEEVDAVFGPATGRPKSAVFRTADVVGLDTFVHVAQNCWDNLPDDERHDAFKVPDFLQQMVKNGWLGSKSGQGFYKKEGKDILSLDVEKLEYREKQKVRYDSLGAVRSKEDTAEKIKTIAWADDKAGRLFWKVGMATAEYAARRLGEIADDIVHLDNGMKWGFGWELGPFETWDAIGVTASVERWQKEGHEVPVWVRDMLAAGRESFYGWEGSQRTCWDPTAKRAVLLDEGEKVKTFTALKREKSRIVKDLFGATLVDLGDGVLACEFHTKMNAIDSDIIECIHAALDLCEEGKFDALVLANDGQQAFSAGANILMVGLAAQQEEWKQLDDMVRAFQNACVRLRYSPVPTVAAPFQLTLGGGAEITMWCDRARAHAETYMGLVEVGVGLIPGGGGNVELLARSLERAIDNPTYPTEMLIQRALETVAMAKVATSAEEAKEYLYLREGIDQVTMNRRHLLEAAKQEALGMVRAGYLPSRRRSFRLPGKGALATFEMALGAMRDGHFISDHDLKIALKVGLVMTGGDTSARNLVSEQQLLDLEREAFLSLCGEKKTQARIMHMLETGKPLRN